MKLIICIILLSLRLFEDKIKEGLKLTGTIKWSGINKKAYQKGF